MRQQYLKTLNETIIALSKKPWAISLHLRYKLCHILSKFSIKEGKNLDNPLFVVGMKAYHSLGPRLVSISHREFLGILQTVWSSNQQQTVANHSPRSLVRTLGTMVPWSLSSHNSGSPESWQNYWVVPGGGRALTCLSVICGRVAKFVKDYK